MIASVLLAGAPVPLDEVFAELTVRHGRGDVDEGPLSSTATLTLVDVTRELTQGFSCGDTLELLTASGPRFTGRITDAALSEEGLQIVAVSSLARMGSRAIGTADYPQEPWSARIIRVFQDAGILLTWAEIPGTFGEHGDTWGELGLAGRLVLEVGSEPDPLVAFREHDRTTLADYLSLLAPTVPAAVADLPDGAILVQRLEARRERATIDLAPDDIFYAPAFAQVAGEAIENHVELTWGNAGEEAVVVAEEPASIERFELRPVQIETKLVVEADAILRANTIVSRRAWPRWLSSPADLLALDEAIEIGSPVRLHDLPAWAPDSGYLGIVEGWEDILTPTPEGIAWTMRLFLSDPRLSGGLGTLWFTVPVETSWAEAGSATWNDPDSLEVAA